MGHDSAAVLGHKGTEFEEAGKKVRDWAKAFRDLKQETVQTELVVVP